MLREHIARRHIAFGLALLLQLLLLAAIPREAIFARIGGVELTLETRPVDPYNVLSGYSVMLAYQVESRDVAKTEPGLHDGEPVWVTVERGDPAWTLVSITRHKPAPRSGRVSLRARYSSWRTTLNGLDRLYIPEAARERVAELMRKSEGRALVDLVADDAGHASVLRLRMQAEEFGAN